MIMALSDRNMKDALQHKEMLAIKAFPHLHWFRSSLNLTTTWLIAFPSQIRYFFGFPRRREWHNLTSWRNAISSISHCTPTL